MVSSILANISWWKSLKVRGYFIGEFLVPNRFIFCFHSVFLDSERSEECIDFTMIITSRNNAPISNFGDGFRCKSEYPWRIKVKS
ncbi:Uncharacterized protein FWK35_00027148 [Aphis craccivora]|uniref:Uncharacterized protein n=1 Tax=Aphis craccivora TaxID=307492 RepID=A0A6G0Z4P0_APHCR|nr:Uncharacterized protein FWK35_00027148 [Aphis craccivora]